MLLLFFALGGAFVLLLIVCLEKMALRRLLINRDPNFAAPGTIYRGRFARFVSGADRLFPDAPSRSYIMMQAYKPTLLPHEDTKFFIRSVGKRGGQHSYIAELRFSVEDRHHAVDALPMLEKIGGPVETTEKSYGLLVLKTRKLSSIDALVDVAQEFSVRVLNCGENDPLTIQWHIAGYNTSTT